MSTNKLYIKVSVSRMYVIIYITGDVNDEYLPVPTVYTVVVVHYSIYFIYNIVCNS